MSEAINALHDRLKILPDVAAHNAVNTPDLRSIFTPQSHEGALDPKREIVVGDRGVGKSFWSSVLKDDAARTAISSIYPALGLNKLRVSLGFAEVIGQTGYASARTIKSLLGSSVLPEFIWRAVILNTINPPLLPPGWPAMDWTKRCEWIKSNSEQEEAILKKFNEELERSGKIHLVIFDALDRVGTDWKTIRLLTRSLLATVLDMRSFSAFRSKLFIRPDMESDREIWSIRDGSKLKQNIVNLAWTSKDLYGFVWHWFLLDETACREFVEVSRKTIGVAITLRAGENIITIPDELLNDEDAQKTLFEVLSGRTMGGSRKGHPYTWIPKHLADARGRVSLRSFIIALRDAARATPMTSPTVLTHEKIKMGVQTASRNRVEQLKEDYVWIEDVLHPLAGVHTPNTDNEYAAKWRRDDTINKIFSLKSDNPGCLIPVELEGASNRDKDIYDKLINALINIGVAERRNDGRLNIPDLFQVASGMLRRGGVPPVQ
jgi:hypothetical protein